ncbi:DNA adenine methylase [Streptococcus uberis]|nr:DNA adenine methylase [Streptococcus uberis]MCK1255199.1 DNA adenine methylase [Streptococcus uberis]
MSLTGGCHTIINTCQKKIDYLSSAQLINHLNSTAIDNLDFREFLEKYKPTERDFIFLDPPYDTEFSTYANNTFDLIDQKRLASYLINDCPANFMLVIKNSDLIRELYNENITTANGKALQIFSFTKKYLVSFRNRNDKNAQHLLITNYEL